MKQLLGEPFGLVAKILEASQAIKKKVGYSSASVYLCEIDKGCDKWDDIALKELEESGYKLEGA